MFTIKLINLQSFTIHPKPVIQTRNLFINCNFYPSTLCSQWSKLAKSTVS